MNKKTKALTNHQIRKIVQYNIYKEKQELDHLRKSPTFDFELCYERQINANEFLDIYEYLEIVTSEDLILDRYIEEPDLLPIHYILCNN